jgi:hypothetical protein
VLSSSGDIISSLSTSSSPDDDDVLFSLLSLRVDFGDAAGRPTSHKLDLACGDELSSPSSKATSLVSCIVLAAVPNNKQKFQPKLASPFSAFDDGSDTYPPLQRGGDMRDE